MVNYMNTVPPNWKKVLKKVSIPLKVPRQCPYYSESRSKDNSYESTTRVRQVDNGNINNRPMYVCTYVLYNRTVCMKRFPIVGHRVAIEVVIAHSSKIFMM